MPIIYPGLRLDYKVATHPHGLQDTPATWGPLLNELRSDPEINHHYQFWVFSYPSGYLGDILAYINDVIHPHGFESIVKDDFAALRQMLQRARSEAGSN